jgi:hypothetical protein
MANRETIIDTGDGGAAAMVAGMVAVAIVAVGLFYFFGMTHTGSKTITVDVPKVTVSVAPPGQ